MIISHLRPILAAILFFSAWQPNWAATFVGMTAEQLVQDADLVVEGRVVSIESTWSEGGGLIVSLATVQVTEVIVGETDKRQIIVQTPGGTVSDFTVEAEGFPQLSQGEQVILFLSAYGIGEVYQIVGHQQGHVEVVQRQDGVTLAVSRVDGESSYFTPSGILVPPMPSTVLGVFKNRIRIQAEQLGKAVSR